jgi:hypothetical protein
MFVSQKIAQNVAKTLFFIWSMHFFSYTHNDNAY